MTSLLGLIRLLGKIPQPKQPDHLASHQLVSLQGKHSAFGWKHTHTLVSACALAREDAHTHVRHSKACIQMDGGVQMLLKINQSHYG